jgi:hypothetical protein
MEHIILIFNDQRRLIAKPPSYEVLVQLSRAYFKISSTAGLSLRYFPLVGSGHGGLDLQPDGFDSVADCTYIILTVLGPLAIGKGIFLNIPAKTKSANHHLAISEPSYNEDGAHVYTPTTSDFSSNGAETPRALATFLESKATLTGSDSENKYCSDTGYGNSYSEPKQGSEHGSDQGNGWGGSYESEQACQTVCDQDNGWGGGYSATGNDPFIEHPQTRTEGNFISWFKPPRPGFAHRVPYALDTRFNVTSSGQNCDCGGTGWNKSPIINWQSTPDAGPTCGPPHDWRMASVDPGEARGQGYDLRSDIGCDNDHPSLACESCAHRDGFVRLTVSGKTPLCRLSRNSLTRLHRCRSERQCHQADSQGLVQRYDCSS